MYGQGILGGISKDTCTFESPHEIPYQYIQISYFTQSNLD